MTTTIRTLASRHPLRGYFGLTFAISWGVSLLAMAAIGGIPETRAQFASGFPFVLAAMLGGPSLAGLAMTAIVAGRSGLRELFLRLRVWRVGVRWYAAALLTAPLLLFALLFTLSLWDPVFLPGIVTADDKASRALFLLAAALATGFLEELGWTGFATPRLLARHTVLATGLAIGVPWGVWHIMGQVVFASGTYTGGLSLPVFLVTGTIGLIVGTLPAYRVLMTWVYERTGSLALAMLMHASLTAATMICEPAGISGGSLLIYSLASTVAWWVLVGMVVVAARGRLWRSVADTAHHRPAGV